MGVRGVRLKVFQEDIPKKWLFKIVLEGRSGVSRAGERVEKGESMFYQGYPTFWCLWATLEEELYWATH